jgi:hypothetical protein
MKKASSPGKNSGNLKIGDHWNAITIIALSQTNPLKAIAEFVENSIDAGAKNITIIRGKQKGDYFLKVIDDGAGISDFSYVATHIGDSIKRKLKKDGAVGIQGEFGIGLLSFWTVGDELVITSTGADGITRRMNLVKGNPAYSVREVPTLFSQTGTELHIQPILAGVRQLSGDKIQNYLASELRDRIAKSGARVRIVDRASRREMIVEPRKFHGRLLHSLPELKSPLGEIYAELYLSHPSSENAVGIYKGGTRIVPEITNLDHFRRFPWTSDYIEGILDVSFLQLTPGTRDGIILDDAFESFAVSLEPLEEVLAEIIREQQRAEEEEASKAILHRVTRALKEAFLLLPQEDYGWLNIHHRNKTNRPDGSPGTGPGALGPGSAADGKGPGDAPGEAPVDGEDPALAAQLAGDGTGRDNQKEFFDFAGPLFSFMVSPSSAVVGVGEKRKFRGVARDKSRRPIDSSLRFEWSVVEGAGSLDSADAEYVEFTAPAEPGLTIIEGQVYQGDECRSAQAAITVTAELIPKKDKESAGLKKGLPGYTYRSAPGELWRSRYEIDKSLIVINNAHPDFIYASRHGITKLRYIARLFAKELVLTNFPESDKEELLERMVELTLYVEENLK